MTDLLLGDGLNGLRFALPMTESLSPRLAEPACRYSSGHALEAVSRYRLE